MFSKVLEPKFKSSIAASTLVESIFILISWLLEWQETKNKIINEYFDVKSWKYIIKTKDKKFVIDFHKLDLKKQEAVLYKNNISYANIKEMRSIKEK